MNIISKVYYLNLKRWIIIGTISFFLFIFVYFFILFGGINLLNDNENNKDFQSIYYEMEFTQDTDDFSYQIYITEEADLLQTFNNVWIDIHHDKGKFSTNNSLKLEDYLSTQKILVKYIENPDWTKSYKDQDFTNLSLIITYFDNDNDEYLSTGDSITLKVENTDNMENYNLTNFTFRLMDLEQNKSLGHVEICEYDDAADHDKNTGIIVEPPS